MAAPNPVNCESNAYPQLRAYVDRRYAGRDASTIEVIFSIAYTEYCKSKKNRLSRIRDGGTKTDHTHVQNVITELCHEDEYKLFCDEADRFFSELEGKFAEQVTSQISGVVIDGLSDDLGKISKNIEKLKHKKGIAPFIKGSVVHAFEIVLATFFLWLLYKTLVVLVPYLGELSGKYWGKITPILETLF